jgi:hypothetical protein
MIFFLLHSVTAPTVRGLRVYFQKNLRNFIAFVMGKEGARLT